MNYQRNYKLREKTRQIKAACDLNPTNKEITDQYHKYRIMIIKLIPQTKTKYHGKQLVTNSKNNKKLWELIKNGLIDKLKRNYNNRNKEQ